MNGLMVVLLWFGLCGTGPMACQPVEPVVSAGDQPDACGPLTDRGQENLVALARLYRLVVRHHPSDQAIRTDWDARLVSCMPTVEAADSDAALLAALNTFIADLGEPLVTIRSSGTTSQPAEKAPRDGPQIGKIGDVLYVALSPGDCCPTAVGKVEDALRDFFPIQWVLDLRHTQNRWFGSIFSEVKVTLAWTVTGGAMTPPRVGRKLRPDEPSDPAFPASDTWRYEGPRRADGPALLGGVPLTVLVDETTHPAAAGWLWGLRQSGTGVIAGRPFRVEADWPCKVALTPTVEALFARTRYVDPEGGPESMDLFLPDVDALPLPGATPAQIAGWVLGGDFAFLFRTSSSPRTEGGSDVRSEGVGRNPPDTFDMATLRVAMPPAPVEGRSALRAKRLAEVIATHAPVRDYGPDCEALHLEDDEELGELLRRAATEVHPDDPGTTDHTGP